jgi:hypothetical protein
MAVSTRPTEIERRAPASSADSGSFVRSGRGWSIPSLRAQHPTGAAEDRKPRGATCPVRRSPKVERHRSRSSSATRGTARTCWTCSTKRPRSLAAREESKPGAAGDRRLRVGVPEGSCTGTDQPRSPAAKIMIKLAAPEVSAQSVSVASASAPTDKSQTMHHTQVADVPGTASGDETPEGWPVRKGAPRGAPSRPTSHLSHRSHRMVERTRPVMRNVNGRGWDRTSDLPRVTRARMATGGD